MNAKTLWILLAAAGATVAVATLSLNREDSAADAGARPKFLPGLAARVNDVASIRVQREGASYTLQRTGDTWGLAEKGGFPVQMDAVRKTILALADMTIVEPKTADPERYEKLGVQDINSPGSKSVLLTLSGKDGAEIAKVVVGKEADLKGALLSGQVYVRRGGEAQSYLVTGSLDLHESGTNWLLKEIVKVPQDRIRSIEVRQPDGETLLVDRPNPETRDFVIHDIPEGKEPTYPTAANSMAAALEYVNLEDVLPAGEVDFTSGVGPIARFVCFDGLVLTVTTKDQDGKSFATFHAAYEPPAAPVEVGPQAPPEAAAASAAKKTPEEVQQEVADLNERLQRWTYVISSYNRTQFGKKRSELLKDRAPANAAPAANPLGGDEVGSGEDGPMVIPGDLPKEIQDQIRAHQESLGNKTVVGPARQNPDGTEPPSDPDEDPKEQPEDGTDDASSEDSATPQR